MEERLQSGAEKDIQRRVKRLERLCLFLSIILLLLGVFGVQLFIDFRRVIRVVGLFSERIDLLCKNVDSICNLIQ